MHVRQSLAALACMAALMAVVPSHAEGRAYQIDAPDGNTYYLYAHGGEFPTGHGLELWQETNGLTDCGVPGGPPIGHATEPDPQQATGLQLAQTTCNGETYDADTRLA